MTTTTKTEHILIVDLEATCWTGKVPEGQENEIIEIGVCLLNTTTGDISDSRGILVKPERSEVSDFCTSLTTITQAMLDAEAVSFSEACAILRKDYHAEALRWASYGAYDQKMMFQQCSSKGIAYPFSGDHINVKTMFAQLKGLKKPTGMAGALGKLGIALEGTHHRGVDDARNIAKILYWNLQQGRQLNAE